MSPKVSILTALYNHERYVVQAIESVLAQTYGSFEHLIWDDGSVDGGFEIAKEYARRHPDRIRVFAHPGGANRGQENTRNAALEQARGEFIGLLDSDDYYHPRKLELLVPCFSNPRIGLAYGRADFLLDEGAKSYPAPILAHPTGRVFDVLVQENFICAGATLFRRSCIERGLRFDVEFRTIGEYPLWLKIARDWELAFVDEAVAVWRSHGANLGTKLALKAKAELVRLGERLLSDPDYADHSAAICRALARKRYDYAAELYLALELEETRRLCLQLIADSSATAAQRGKAAALAALTLAGLAPNRVLSRVKRRFWELRTGIRARRKS